MQCGPLMPIPWLSVSHLAALNSGFGFLTLKIPQCRRGVGWSQILSGSNNNAETSGVHSLSVSVGLPARIKEN